jgi:hypothetical protein
MLALVAGNKVEANAGVPLDTHHVEDRGSPWAAVSTDRECHHRLPASESSNPLAKLFVVRFKRVISHTKYVEFLKDIPIVREIKFPKW